MSPLLLLSCVPMMRDGLPGPVFPQMGAYTTRALLAYSIFYGINIYSLVWPLASSFSAFYFSNQR